MHFREYVEVVMVNRLIRRKPDDLDVLDDEYTQMVAHLEPIIKKISHDRRILGFTAEDLESFMHLKVHQVLRRGKYDPSRPARSFFQVTFNFLMNDINRMKNKAIEDCMTTDALDDCFEYVSGMDDYVNNRNVMLGEDQ